MTIPTLLITWFHQELPLLSSKYVSQTIIFSQILTNRPQYLHHCVCISILTNFALWTMSFHQELPIPSIDHVTSSYVYIRLVLTSHLRGKIQWAPNDIVIFPTFSIITHLLSINPLLQICHSLPIFCLLYMEISIYSIVMFQPKLYTPPLIPIRLRSVRVFQ